ncbi:MAG: hypothetical protein RLZZ127_1168 [Planctomycetota bacterium]|jgi:hypothetical protein
MKWLGLAVTVLLLGAVVAGGRGPAPAPAATVPEWTAGTARLSAEEIAAAPARIDALVDAALAKAGIAAAPPLDDRAFLRRAALDLLGRLPTGEETAAYLLDQAPDRHQRMTARFLASPAHAQVRYLQLADLFRVQSQMQGRYPGHAYIAWLQQQALANRPWDALVRDLVTASGPAFARAQGASGYWLRDAGMPIDRVAHETQALLGTRVGCAQCHDHPYDSWTRQQYWQAAAFTAETKVDRRPANPGQTGPALRKVGEGLGPQERNILRQISFVTGTQVIPGRSGSVVLPADWSADDGPQKPGSRLAAATLWAAQPAAGDPRAAWAAWLTSPENPRFATVMAHRLWVRLMGYPIAPVDTWTDGTVPADPELLDLLSRLLVSTGFDLDRVEGALVRTRAYRRSAVAGDAATAGHRAGPLLRRLSAEQIWDSLVVLAVPDPDAGFPVDAAALWERQERYAGLDAAGIKAEVERLAARRERVKAIDGELAAARARKDRAAQRRLQEERTALQAEAEAMGARRPAARDAMVRAAVLPQPAPPGHALRVLGQSDRELIDNGSLGPSVPQALLMLNGVVEQQIANRPTSAILKHAAAAADADGRIERLWTGILGRLPSDDERTRARAHLDAAKGSATALGDLAWALITSTEFLFRP